VDKRYELFCLADPLFYDSPNRSGTADRCFAAVTRPLPAGWAQTRLGEWQVQMPPGDPLPAQGWKIHVSASAGSAERVLGRLFDYCVPRQLSFKFLRSPLALHLRNAKYAPRGASGKLVTIYPTTDASCERTLAELNDIVGGEPGPYILSDLRYGEGPLYVRYGGFTERHCRNAGGELVPAIEDDTGQLVPDVRGPVFTLPDWVTLPSFLAPHLAARNAVTVKDLPYQIDQALHFSNGGGVYAGTDSRTGDRVVLKEARPYAGLAADGSDAVARLRREHEILRQLSGLDVVPGVHGYFPAGDHHFLVEDHIDGVPLNSLYAHRYPLIGAAPDPVQVAGYTSWALGVCADLERAVQAIHDRGVVVNDLHMFNIMIRPDDSVALIDFEAAAHVEEGRRPALGNPGFVAPRDRTGFDIDRYSLACVKLAMFLPLTTLFALDRGKAEHVAEVIAEHFPVTPQFLDGAVASIVGPPQHRAGRPPGRGTARPGPATARPGTAAASTGPASANTGPQITPDQPGWERARHLLVQAIQASATLAREDRLFPGDIEQFAAPSGGLCVATGAAGVLYALSEAGAGVLPEHAEWLVRRVAEPVPGARLGLYDGLIGVASVLHRLGHPAAALRVAQICLAERWERLGTDLHGGLPGLALALLELGAATGETRLLEAGLRATDMVAAGRPARAAGSGGPAGLLRGSSGPALLFIRTFERTRDHRYLDLAAAAIGADLDRCVLDGQGALKVDEGWRLMPYLDGGSAGVGLVIDDFLAHRRDDRFEQAVKGIRAAACSTYFAQPSLFRGRAGMLLYLSHGRAPGDAAGDPQVAAHVRRLAWHAISYRGGTAFPGETLFRLSMDLATGTAGVLLGLASALSPDGARLPCHYRPAQRPDARTASVSGHPDVPGSSGQGLQEVSVITRR
jgi:tRNA A-37 threonylcarbamoyl transferase component Bud32